MAYVFVLSGLGLLLVGAEVLVRGAVRIAYRLNISLLFVGTVIVGFGTSAPELAVSLNAALTGKPDIALGNVVGSNIANILLILGIAAVMCPLIVAPTAVRRETLVMLASTGALFIFANLGELPVWAGGLFVSALAVFLTYAYWTERSDTARSPERELHEHGATQFDGSNHRLAVSIPLVLGGLVGVIGGAQLLVDGAATIARDFGISEAAIGLTMVAIGTSLPELATAIAAALRKQTDVIVGNIIGSNIFNILGVLGTTLLVTKIGVPDGFFDDLVILLGVSMLVVPPLLIFGRIDSTTGIVFLLVYIGYLAWIFQTDQASGGVLISEMPIYKA